MIGVESTAVEGDVDRVLRSLGDWHPAAVRSLAVSVGMAEEPLRGFGQALDYFSDALSDPAISGDLARLSMRRALRLAGRHPRCGEVLERLEGVAEPPWPQVRAALAGAVDGR